MKIDLQISLLKPIHANWLMDVIFKLKMQEGLIKTGFDKAGITSFQHGNLMYLTTVSLNYNFMCFAVTNVKKYFVLENVLKPKYLPANMYSRME